MKTLSDLETDAIMIEGLVDGINALYGSEEPNASNAIIPTIDAAKQRLNQMMADLHEMSMAQRAPQPPKPTTPLQPVASDAPARTETNGTAALFDAATQNDHVACLYRIRGLAEFGVCSTDNTWGRDLKDNYSLYEQIGLLAAQAIDAAEKAEREAKSAA